MVLKINGLTLALGEREDLLPARVASLLGLSEGAITELRVIRRSIDARRSRPPRFVFLLVVRLADGVGWRPGPGRNASGVSVTEAPDIPDESLTGTRGQISNLSPQRERYRFQICPQAHKGKGTDFKSVPGLQQGEGDRFQICPQAQRPVVAGCGPAGLFAALTLAAKGMPVLLLERGKAVPERLSDVRAS